MEKRLFLVALQHSNCRIFTIKHASKRYILTKTTNYYKIIVRTAVVSPGSGFATSVSNYRLLLLVVVVVMLTNLLQFALTL
jgi:hypothetical protein